MVVVTGATGHIGGNLVRALLARGRTVRVLVRRMGDPALAGLDIDRCQGDILDPASLNQAFAGAQVVYHLAGRISLLGGQDPLLHTVNVTGTQHVAEAALRCGVARLVHFSSLHAFDLESQPTVDETAPRPGPGHPAYDRSKAAAEQVIREVIARGLDAVIVNPSGVIGPHDYRPSRLGQVLIDLRDQRLPALVQGHFDAVDVRDVVAGALAAEEHGQCGQSYLLCGQRISVADFARLACEICGSQPPRWVCPAWLAALTAPVVTTWSRLSSRPPLYTPDGIRALRHAARISSARAAQELGYSSRPLEESLRSTYSFFDRAGR